MTTSFSPLLASLVVASLGLCFFAAGADGAPPTREQLPGPDQLPSVKELPDPFRMSDGTRVKTKEDWKRRREELMALVLGYEYGQLPPHPGTVKATAHQWKPSSDPKVQPKGQWVSSDKLPAGTKQEHYLLSMGPEGKVTTQLILTMPENAGKKRLPVVVRGDLNWGRVSPETAAEVVKRGYILAEFDRTMISPDSADRTKGVYAAYPESDGSALSAWAWGYHRVIDYLLTRDDVDKDRIAVTGHSRGGKATLLAGATDERIALTVPNNSGCGGAGCYRFQYGKSEDIEAITKRFPYWFQARFNEFVGKVDRLPFDQHSVKALVAPRALLSTEALGDVWANPEGSGRTHLAAKEVFDFLGAADKIGIYYREGGHAHNHEDWRVLLDFADKVFFDKKPDREFDKVPFETKEKTYTWAAPAK